MKFEEAALFRVAVSPSGKIRDGTRQGRAGARLIRGLWLGKTTESDEHLLANKLGVHTTRTVRRVPDTEQKRVRLGERFARNSVEQACRTPSGRTSQNRFLKRAPVATPPAAEETERPSEDADECRSAKAQDLNPPAVPSCHPSSSRSRHRERTEHIVIQNHGDQRWGRSSRHSQRRSCAGPIAGSCSEQTNGINKSEWRTTVRELRCQA